MRLSAALEALRPLHLDLPAATKALEDYATLAEQATVLAELLPEQREQPDLLRRGESGLRRQEEVLLAKLQTLIPVNEAAVDALSYDDEAPRPLTDIPFQPWYPHDEEMLSEFVHELPEAERLASILSWGATPDQVAVSFDLEEVPSFSLPRYEEAIAALELAPEPVRFLADALRVVNKDTGLAVWDSLCECGGACGHGLPWNIGDILAVAAQRAEADAIGERLVALSRWIHEDPDGRIPQLMQAMESKR